MGVPFDELDRHDTCEQTQRSSGISVYGRISVFNGLMRPICVERYIIHVNNINVVTYNKYHVISYS